MARDRNKYRRSKRKRTSYENMKYGSPWASGDLASDSWYSRIAGGSDDPLNPANWKRMLDDWWKDTRNETLSSAGQARIHNQYPVALHNPFDTANSLDIDPLGVWNDSALDIDPLGVWDDGGPMTPLEQQKKIYNGGDDDEGLPQWFREGWMRNWYKPGQAFWYNNRDTGERVRYLPGQSSLNYYQWKRDEDGNLELDYGYGSDPEPLQEGWSSSYHPDFYKYGPYEHTNVGKIRRGDYDAHEWRRIRRRLKRGQPLGRRQARELGWDKKKLLEYNSNLPGGNNEDGSEPTSQARTSSWAQSMVNWQV